MDDAVEASPGDKPPHDNSRDDVPPEDEAVQERPTRPRRATAEHRNRKMIATVAVIVLVLVLSGVLISLATRSSGPDKSKASTSATGGVVPPRGPKTAVYDRFDRADRHGSLGTAETGQKWRTWQPMWSIVNGTARMEPRHPARGALAVVSLGSTDGSVQVTLTKIASGAGIVFRDLGLFNYWEVTAAPKFATWNVRKVFGGKVIQVGNTGRNTAADGTTVGVTFVADKISIQINGKQVFTTRDPLFENARFVGLVGIAGTAASPRWDNFVGSPVTTTTTRTAPFPLIPTTAAPRPN